MVVNIVFTVLCTAYCVLMFASDYLLGKKVKALEAEVEWLKKRNSPKM